MVKNCAVPRQMNSLTSLVDRKFEMLIGQNIIFRIVMTARIVLIYSFEFKVLKVLPRTILENFFGVVIDMTITPPTLGKRATRIGAGERTMTNASRKIFYQDEKIGIEVTDAEFSVL